MTLKCTGDKKTNKHFYIPHMLRSRPLRCTSLPIFSMFLFIIYWFIICPLIYVGLKKNCKLKNCSFPEMWPWYFWITALIVFIIILLIILCIWCCKPKKKMNKATEQRQKEYQKLLKESFDYNSLKSKDTVDIVNERPLPEKIIKQFDLAERPKTLTKVDEESPDKSEINDPTVEKIDLMFPRCSVRRKNTVEVKKRPETLVLQSSTDPKKDSPQRHSLQEEIRPISPLTPREIFFYDLFRSAHLQSMDKTWKFIENEKKHSSNHFDNPLKPEVKDFILKQKPSTSTSSPSSPEFFIANVSGHNQPCTSEAFVYVDGGQSEKELTICYLEEDEKVFTP